MAYRAFISYSHKDKKYRDALEGHFAPMRRSDLLATWHDGMIEPGKPWEEAIFQNLRQADVIFLLISSDFFHSAYIMDKEVPEAIQRHHQGLTRVIPILVRSVNWDGHPLSELQAIRYQDKPIGMSRNRDAAWADAVGQVRRLLSSGQTPAAAPVIAHHPVTLVNLPKRNPLFSGRVEFLATLRRTLRESGPAALTQAAVYGTGGVGKSQLALEYAHAHGEEYDVRWWVHAETMAGLRVGLLKLADGLGLRQGEDDQTRITALKEWLASHDRWLLVFDNVEEPKEVREHLPETPRGHVIHTSRSPHWLGIAHEVPLARFPRAESLACLGRYVAGDMKGADAVAALLGDFPLALAQAGAYVHKNRVTWAGYAKALRQSGLELLEQGEPLDYHATVRTTWSLAMARLQRDTPAALALLNLLAFLDPDGIPVALLTPGWKNYPEPLALVIKDELALTRTITALRAYSLVEREGDKVTLHRVVQDVVRERMGEDEEKNWVVALLALVQEAFPFDWNDPATWRQDPLLPPQLPVVAGHGERLGVGWEMVWRLFSWCALYHERRAAHATAVALYRRALASAEQGLGTEHGDTAACAHNLAMILRDLRELSEAKALAERALAINEKVHGPEHHEVANSAGNLGGIHWNLGEWDRARELLERALAIEEKVFGPNHVYVATHVSNLSLFLRDQGDLPVARTLVERALVIDEKELGLEHPSVAIRLNNLGLILQDQGELAGARASIERALAIDEKVYGPNHPLVAKRADHLAAILQAQGDEARAAAMREKARQARQAHREEVGE